MTINFGKFYILNFLYPFPKTGSFLRQIVLFQIIFKCDIRPFGTILGQFNPSRTPRVPIFGFYADPGHSKNWAGDWIFGKLRYMQKWRVGVELEAETFTNRLSVQSYVAHAPKCLA